MIDNPPEALWTAATAWGLEEDLRIGVTVGDPNEEFGRVASIAIDASGRIYILDRQARSIRLFDSNGGFIRTIGRPGSGPGELEGPSIVVIGSGDTIFVPDMANQRVQRFKSDGSRAGSFPLPLVDAVPLSWASGPDGALLQEVRVLSGGSTAPAVGSSLVLLLSSDGAVRDTLLELPPGEALRVIGGQPQMTLFAPEPMWTTLVDGRVASGRNSEYRFEIQSPDGGLRLVRRPSADDRQFSKADQDGLRALLAEWYEAHPPSAGTAPILRSLEYADRYPAFAALFGGPAGSLWVQQAHDFASLSLADMEDFNVRAMGRRQWDVFDRDGRYLGELEMPDRFQPMRTAGQHVYGVQRDSLGVQQVVRLRVVM